MKKNISKFMYGLLVASLMAGLIVALIPASPVSAAGFSTTDPRNGPGGNGQGTSSGTAVGSGISKTPLTDAEALGLEEAILEEYKAFNLYTSAINQLGNVVPFQEVLNSEQQHINTLIKQSEKYGVIVPENPGIGSDPVFSELTAACQAGVAAELEDAALYDSLKSITTNTDILRVYENLQNASLDSHLIEFQACD